MDWISLDSARVMRQHGTFITVKPKGVSDPAPLFCVVCGSPNLTSDDILTFREHACCSACAMRWVDVHRQKWSEGWRPSPSEIEAEVARRRARPARLPF